MELSVVKDRVKDGGGGASTNAHRNPHLVRGLGFWQCGGCAPRDDERGRRPARRGLRRPRTRTRGSDVISGAWRTGQRLPRPGLGRIPHPPVPRGARSREMGGQGTAEGCPQGGSRLPPASPVHPRFRHASPDPGPRDLRADSRRGTRRATTTVDADGDTLASTHDCAGSAVSATTRTSIFRIPRPNGQFFDCEITHFTIPPIKNGG